MTNSPDLNTALAAFRAGDLRGAERACRTVLERSPANTNASLLMGMVQASMGNLAEAEKLFRRVAAAQPQRPDVHFNLGLVLAQAQRQADAVQAFDRTIALDPRNISAYAAKANALEALQRQDDAVLSLDRALALNPTLAVLWLQRGSLLQQLGKSSDALTSYEKAAAQAPENSHALNAAGTVLNALGRFDDAITRFTKAIAIDPEFGGAFSNRAVSYTRLQRFELAEADHLRALQLAPDDAAVLANYAEFLDANYRPAEAEQVLDRLEPLDQVSALVLRGNVLSDQLRLAEARTCYDRALNAQPDLAYAHWCRGLLDLREGRLREGFEGFEQRRRATRNLPGTEWQPDTTKPGTKLFLYAEHGLGDTIHFARYAPLLIEQGYAVTMEVQPALAALCRSLHPALTVVAAGSQAPVSDFHCALPSLPFKLRTDLGSVPARVPYLTPQASGVASWAIKLSSATAPRIGLCWSGNIAHQRDAKRSIPLTQLIQSLESVAATFVSLQRDLRDRDAISVKGAANLVDWTRELSNFEDTAALIASLDLVITVDTSVAHLAGALGKPVWILLPFAPDWRWMLSRDDSPWYPSAKLFRQTEPGGWSDPVRQVRDELKRLLV